MLEKKTRRNNGQGNITPSGYVRIKVNGKLYMEHKYIWERVNGKIPLGFDVHHIDGNKKNNSISNLELLTRQDHIRKHKGWYKKNDTWYKPCYSCHQHLEVNDINYYFTTDKNKNTPVGTLLFGICKSCHIKGVDRARKIKKITSRSFSYSA